MRLALLSDTHGNPLIDVFDALAKVKPDLIIHAGDVAGHHPTRYGRVGDSDDREAQLKRFLTTWNPLAWKMECPIVMIPGNHDFFLAPPQEKGTQWSWDFQRIQRANRVSSGWLPPEIKENLDSRITILNQSGVRVAGLKIWGSPWSPHFNGWAYNFAPPLFDGAQDAAEHWDQIPADTDLLITHGPPHGILDHNPHGEACGCPALLRQFTSGRIAPKCHVFGHIHSARGQEQRGEVLFVNASMCDEENRLKHPMTVVDI